jgi:hypothetical protein
MKTKVMIDSNIFNRIIDDKYDLRRLADYDCLVTHIQLEELQNTPSEDRRAKLISIFREISPEEIPTDTFVLGESLFGCARLGDGDLWDGIRKAMESKLSPAQRGKRADSITRDALIAEAAINANAVLLSADAILAEVVLSLGGKSVNPDKEDSVALLSPD